MANETVVTAPEIVVKTVDEVINVTANFAGSLKPDEIVSTISIEPTEDSNTSGLTLGTGTIVGDTVTFNVSAGTNLLNYSVKTCVTTSLASNVRCIIGRVQIRNK